MKIFVVLTSGMVLLCGAMLLSLRVNNCGILVTSEETNTTKTLKCGLFFEAIGGEGSMDDIYIGQFKKLFVVKGVPYVKVFFGGFEVSFPLANNDDRYNLYVFENSKEKYREPYGEVKAVVYQTEGDNLKKINDKFKNKYIDFSIVSPNFVADYLKRIREIYEKENVEEFRKKMILEELEYYSRCDDEIQLFSKIMKESNPLKRIINGLRLKFDNNTDKCLPKISSIKVYL